MAIREGERLVDMRFFCSRLMEVVRLAQVYTRVNGRCPGVLVRACLLEVAS